MHDFVEAYIVVHPLALVKGTPALCSSLGLQQSEIFSSWDSQELLLSQSDPRAFIWLQPRAKCSIFENIFQQVPKIKTFWGLSKGAAILMKLSMPNKGQDIFKQLLRVQVGIEKFVGKRYLQIFSEKQPKIDIYTGVCASVLMKFREPRSREVYLKPKKRLVL